MNPHELWIGDYSIILHVPEGTTLKEVVKKVVSESIAGFGLKVVEVED